MIDTGHPGERNKRGGPRLQEHDDDDRHEADCDEQRTDHVGDRLLDHCGGVIRDVIIQSRRKILLELPHLRFDGVRERKLIRSWRLEDANG